LYKLLIVTRDARVENMFSSMQGWEARGYKQPRLRATVKDAKECMLKHHIDAIAVDHDEEFAPLNRYLDMNFPILPIFQIESNAEKQFETLKEVHRLLSQLHSDDSDDGYDEAYYFRLIRERWMKTLISGSASTPEHILNHHRLYRCTESLTAPCVFSRLSLPSGETFLTGPWHYGSDRLEVALRNFYGTGQDSMTIYVAVVSPEEVRVLACPWPQFVDNDTFGPDVVMEYLEETNEQIEQYLGLKMKVVEIRMLSGLTAFASLDAVTR